MWVVGARIREEKGHSAAIGVGRAPEERAKRSLDRLLAWIESSPAVTPDPYDIKTHPWFARRLASRERFLSRLALKAAYVPAALFPESMPRLLGVQRKQTSNAAAWIAQGYLELFRLSKVEKHLRTAELWLNRLREMRLSAFEDYCWGFHSDWQTSTVIIPANSPVLYTNWQAGRAFLDHYEATRNEESLDTALSVCCCLLRVLNKPVDNQRHLCLTYSPHDSMQVFNTNALAGALLCRVGILAHEPHLTNCGQRMLKWVADGQRPDGSWEYFSRPFRKQGSFIDNYHTAMTLQGLLDGRDSLSQDGWTGNLEHGLRFYLEQMLDRQGRPKFTPSSTYPIDVMSCAEGLILLCKVRVSPIHLPSALRSDALERLDQLLEWVCRRFQADAGPFYYRAYPGVRLRLFSFRWGQGAMLKALASFLSN